MLRDDISVVPPVPSTWSLLHSLDQNTQCNPYCQWGHQPCATILGSQSQLCFRSLNTIHPIQTSVASLFTIFSCLLIFILKMKENIVKTMIQSFRTRKWEIKWLIYCILLSSKLLAQITRYRHAKLVKQYKHKLLFSMN